MAVIKAINSKASIGKAINYVTKEKKTEEKLISGKDCNPKTAIDEMKLTKEQWGKTEGRQYKHYVQSFNPQDKITPEKAHEIGRKFVNDTEKFKGHEVIIATHVDKGHIHNHFIVNSVNFENGKKYQERKQDLEKFKERSNQLSRENGLTVPTKGREITSFNQKKYKAIEKGFVGKENSYVLDTAKEVSNSLKKAKSREEFIKNMENKGYQVNWKDTRKYITFTTPEGKKVRNNNLEKTFKEQKFSKGGIENAIQRNREREKERGSTVRAFEGNQRAEPVNAGIHKGTHERGYSDSNDNGSRIGENKKNQSRDTEGNEFDINKAREHAENLRKQTVSGYGNWKERNEHEQSNNPRENDRDRAEPRGQNERNEQQNKRTLERIREQEFGFDR